MKTYLIAFCLVFFPLLSMAQLPQTQLENQIKFIQGGVGSDESDAIKLDAKNWPLLLEFSKRNGNQSEWVSDVSVVINNSTGSKVFEYKINGPMLLIDLKPGKYAIESSFENQKIVTNLNVISGQHKTISISWK